jgi:parvulin-like peptidyl-prolyl isomerase
MRTNYPTLRTRFVLTLALATLGIAGCAADGQAPVGEATTVAPPADMASPAAESPAAESPAAESPATAVDAGATVPPSDGADAATLDLAARVNGQDLPLADFQTQAFDTQRYFVDQGLDPNTDDGQAQLRALRRQVLDDMINQVLIEQYAAEQNLDVSADALDIRMRDYVDQAGGEDKFAANLQETGTTRESVREMERKSLIGQQVMDLIAGDVPETAEHRHARHILCDTEEVCQQALDRIRAGEDFATVAKEISIDVTTAPNGGDLDWLARGMVPSAELENAIFSLPIGQVSEVVHTDFGYHVIEVLESDPNRPLTDEQRYSLREKRLLDWLADRRASSEIEILIPDLAQPAS